MTRPLRIAYLLTQDRGGPVDLCVNLASTIRSTGAAEVRIFGPEPARGAEQVADLVEPVAVGTKGDVAAMRRTRETLLEWRPDVLHAQDRRSGLVAAAVRRLPGAPPAVLHTYHGVPDDVAEPWFRGVRGTAPPSRYTRTVLAADAVVARSVHRTLVPSAAMIRFLQRRLRIPGHRLLHLDNGVRMPSPVPPEGPVRRLLFVGLLVERKGVSDLLAALARPGTMPADAHLSIAGDGPEREALAEAVASGPLRGRVEFLGFRTDVHDLMKRSDALVLPSRMEQQPLVIAEAMGAAKPVVATDTGGVAEMLDADGATPYLAPPGDVTGLAAALRRLFDDPDPARTGSALAAHAHARFSVERACEAHMRLYARLVPDAGRR